MFPDFRTYPWPSLPNRSTWWRWWRWRRSGGTWWTWRRRGWTLFSVTQVLLGVRNVVLHLLVANAASQCSVPWGSVQTSLQRFSIPSGPLQAALQWSSWQRWCWIWRRSRTGGARSWTRRTWWARCGTWWTWCRTRWSRGLLHFLFLLKSFPVHPHGWYLWIGGRQITLCRQRHPPAENAK